MLRARTRALVNDAKEVHNERDFLSALFDSLDRHDVRYCVLHSWDLLPHSIPTDLDIGIHPEDKPRLASAFADIEAAGYVPVQCLNYIVNAYYAVFAWLEEAAPRFAALDIIFEHRRGGLIMPTGSAMVENRHREGKFWVPDPAVEFAYLLSKKAWKRSITTHQLRRLQWLVNSLGITRAQQIAEQVFTSRVARQVIAAISHGTLDRLLPKLGRHASLTGIRRHPFRVVRCFLEDVWRRLKRWRNPTGLFVVFAGPDGVGKSTIIAATKDASAKAFRGDRVFHWRPGFVTGELIKRKAPLNASTVPHQSPPRPAPLSVAALLAHFADYWLGYLLSIRMMLARTTLVLFDRYFYDVAIDPLRFEFGGPMWLPTLLRRFVPTPDLVFVLDAPDSTILERKQELSLQELQRQRRAFGDLARNLHDTAIVSTEEGIDSAKNRACSVIISFLAERCRRRELSSTWQGGIFSRTTP